MGHMEERWGGGLSSSRPIVRKSCTRMAILLYYFIAKDKGLFPPTLEDNNVKSFRARGRVRALAGELGTPGRPVEDQCYGRVRDRVVEAHMEQALSPGRCVCRLFCSCWALSGRDSCSQPYFTGHSHNSKLLGSLLFLIGKRRSTKYTPLRYPLWGS